MPVEPKFEWNETYADLSLTVDVRQSSAAGIDVEITDSFVKVNVPPLLLALDLYREVNSAVAAVQMQDKSLKISLVKTTPGLWRRIKAEGPVSVILQRRFKSIEKNHQRLRKLKEESDEQRRMNAQAVVNRKLEKEKETRDKITTAKKKELENERQNLKLWKEALDTEEVASADTACALHDVKNNCESLETSDQKNQQLCIESHPRRTVAEPVKVEFTELESCVLPARENREKELKLYKKQYQSKHDAVAADGLKIEERHPQYLKDKGDVFYEQGNYRSAIHAYSRAIEADENGLRAYANRAAAYFALDNYTACISDCSTSLTMLDANLQQSEETGEGERELKKLACKVLCRQGAARAQLKDYQEAIEDFRSALEYDPENSTAKQNYSNVTALLSSKESKRKS